jgi:hypothetical protein
MDERIPSYKFSQFPTFKLCNSWTFHQNKFYFPFLPNSKKTKAMITSSIRSLRLWNNFRPTFKFIKGFHNFQMNLYYNTFTFFCVKPNPPYAMKEVYENFEHKHKVLLSHWEKIDYSKSLKEMCLVSQNQTKKCPCSNNMPPLNFYHHIYLTSTS